MKVMGFRHLSLVAPRNFPAAAAIAMASGADDLLISAQVVETLEAAVSGCAMVFGTTARDRHLQWPILFPAQAAAEAEIALADGPVAAAVVLDALHAKNIPETTIRRAKKSLNVIVKMDGQSWWWSLETA